MDAIERAAFISVGRACGFAGLAILCLMVGLSFDPLVAARTGGMATFAMTLFLGFRAKASPSRPYRHTEVWIMLAKSERPDDALAQKLIGSALREAYIWFARQTALVTIILWIAVVVLSLAVPGRT